MHVWLVKMEEMLPFDEGYRPYRMGMLADCLLARGHTVTRWAADYEHGKRAPRTGKTGPREISERYTAFLLSVPVAYAASVSLRGGAQNSY